MQGNVGSLRTRVRATKMFPPLNAIAVASLSTGVLASPHATRSAIAACDGIFLNTEMRCAFVGPDSCKASCRADAVERSCIATLAADCDAQCSETLSSDCTEACEPSCESDCGSGPRSSGALCRRECRSDCTDECKTSSDPHCAATCAHNCSEKCSDYCLDDDQSGTCGDKCGATCEGRCAASSTLGCQMSCQAKGYASCETATLAKCEADCERPLGALFCDGQFVNAEDPEGCAAIIDAQVSTPINFALKTDSDSDVYAHSGVSCAVRPASGRVSAWPSLAALGLLFVLLRRRA
jgi:hypothetical protein